IDAWNSAQEQAGSPQRVRCGALYRWPRLDQWFIEGKLGVIEDFMDALNSDYRWQREHGVDELPEIVPPPATPEEPPATRRKSRKRKRGQPEQAPPYRIEWVDDRFPPHMTAGQVIVVPVTLLNTGSVTWRWA